MTDRYDTTGNPEDEYYPGTEVVQRVISLEKQPAILNVDIRD
jgi:hypothetical protein